MWYSSTVKYQAGETMRAGHLSMDLANSGFQKSGPLKWDAKSHLRLPACQGCSQDYVCGCQKWSRETGSRLAWRRVAGNRQILGTSPPGSQDTRQQHQPLALQSSVQNEGADCLIQKVLKISRQEEQSGREPPEHSTPKPRALGDSREGRSVLQHPPCPLRGGDSRDRSVGQPCPVGDSGDQG